MSADSTGPRGPRRSGVTVTGTGAAAAAVDQVVINVGISLIRSDAGDAFQAAAEAASRVLSILADDGVDSRSVRTADLTFAPHSEYREHTEVHVGYRAGQRLIVHLSTLAGLERMLTDVATGGGEGVRIDRLQLTPSDPAEALARARAAAYADARAKATQLADLAGRTLGELTWIDELPEHAGRERSVGLAVGMGFSAVPIAAGDTTIVISVTAHWNFEAVQ